MAKIFPSPFLDLKTKLTDLGRILPGKPLRLVLVLVSVLVISNCSSCLTPTANAPVGNKNGTDIADNTKSIKDALNKDSLTQLAKSQGRGAVKGALVGETKSIMEGLLKVATNAAGERRLISATERPLQGATILIFDALKASTLPETTLTTDSAGNYVAILKEGQYIGFAVHLDLETFQLVTASIPYIHPIRDSLLQMDTAIALEDITSPTVSAVYDAITPDESQVFYVSPMVSTDARFTVTFSEPMQRESVKGVLLGRLDTNSQSVALRDTLPSASVLKTWSGDSKQLTLSISRLETGTRYGLILNGGLKDLAKNPLEREYRAVFKAVSADQLDQDDFNLSSTFPLEGESLKPTQNPVLTFNRPPLVTSALKGLVVRPYIEGYWEAAGSRLTFIHKNALPPGTSFSITIPDTLLDMQGHQLGKTLTVKFEVKDFDGAVKEKSGKEQLVAIAMEEFFTAYLQGDVGRIAGVLSPNFRFETDGQLLSSQQFLDRLRRLAGDQMRLRSGFVAPIYQTSATACDSKTFFWKVASQNNSDTLWVQAFTATGLLPKVFRQQQEITSGITWAKGGRSFSLNGNTFIYALGETDAAAAASAAGDLGFLGALLRQNTTIVTDKVRDTTSESFTIDGGIEVTLPTAKVAVKWRTLTRRGRSDWNTELLCNPSASLDTIYRILKYFLKTDGSRWYITHAVDEGLVAKSQFEATIKASEFKAKEIKPITLISPVQNAERMAGSDGSVTFKFRGLDLDSVGGYLIGIAEDPKFIGSRLPYGGLFFVKSQGKGAEHTFIIDAKAAPGPRATAILREVSSLNLPGWERESFKAPLPALASAETGISGVYNWKAIAVSDSTAAQFLTHGFSAERYFGESDFGPSRGYFAVKTFPTAAEFAKLDQQTASSSQATMAASYLDRDLDGFPDAMEINYKTKPDDKGSFPNFFVDTDRDGLADFLELLLDTTGSLSTTAANDAQRKTEIQNLGAKGMVWLDSDGDGFPDDIENLLGYGSTDASSHPATRAKVSPPLGTFAGLLRMGDLGFPVKFKVRNEAGKLLVNYSAALQDTLSDSVLANLNDAMGEFAFPIRLADRGPDSGTSLLLRGTFDVNRAFLAGSVNRIASIPRTSITFGIGPFVGQFAASGRGEDVTDFLGLGAKPTTVSQNTGSIAGTPTSANTAATVGFRLPPTGLTNDSRVSLISKGGRVYQAIVLDEFGDTAFVMDSVIAYPQEGGVFGLDGRHVFSNAKAFYVKRTEWHALVGTAKGETNQWVIDGSFSISIDTCRSMDATQGQCIEKMYRDIPGQFSAKVAASDASVQVTSQGIAGNFKGWVQQDKFGIGLTPSTTAPAGSSGTVTVNPANLKPPQSLSKALTGGLKLFQSDLAAASIVPGDFFYAALGNRVLRVTYDSTHVLEGAFPYCGNVLFKPTLLPLLDGASQAERDAFKRDLTWLFSGIYAALVLEDGIQEGRPAVLAKAKDALGFTRTHVYIIELRQVDASTFLGEKCLEGNITPPPNPSTSVIPIPPTGAAYYLGDLTTAQLAVNQTASQATVLGKDGKSIATISLNAGTLRKDPVTGVVRIADGEDPSIGYMLLANPNQTNQVLLTENLPSVTAE